MTQGYSAGYSPYSGLYGYGGNSYLPQGQGIGQQGRFVEVVPVDSIEEALKCPMTAGTRAIFFARDDSFNVSRQVGFNGEQENVVFLRKPQEQPQAPVDLSEYVRRDEIEEIGGPLMQSVRRVAAETVAAMLEKKGGSKE